MLDRYLLEPWLMADVSSSNLPYSAVLYTALPNNVRDAGLLACWPVRGDKIGGNPIHMGVDGGCQQHQRRLRVKTWCQKKPEICSPIKADPWSLICKGAATNNRVWEAWEARPSFPLPTAANIKYYHPQLPGHGKYPAPHPRWPGLDCADCVAWRHRYGKVHTCVVLWWCCGGANFPYCTASDCPVLSDISTLPLPRTMPSIPAAKRTSPSTNIQQPNFDSDSARRETDLTSTRTIDARHRRRHAYLTPPTKHIPVKVGQTKTKPNNQIDQPLPLPCPRQTSQRSRTIAPFSPRPSGHVRPRNGPSTLPSPPLPMPARPNSASLPSPSRPSRGAGADHQRPINPLWPPQPRSPSHPQSCATFSIGFCDGRPCTSDASCRVLVQWLHYDSDSAGG
jgi:hypothetical protein